MFRKGCADARGYTIPVVISTRLVNGKCSAGLGSAIVLNDGEAVRHWSYKVFLLLIAFFFFDGFWRHGGQTLGMRAWRIRVEGMNSEDVTFKQSLHRFLAGLFAFGFTLLYMYGNASQLALHDKLSKTRIIRYNK